MITFITDCHFCYSPPDKRIDNLFDGQFNKYEEFIKVTNQFDAIPYIGGDFTDVHRPPLWFINMLNILTITCKNKIQCVIGNHDIIGYNLESYKDCALGNFVSAGLMEIAKGRIIYSSPKMTWTPDTSTITDHTIYKDTRIIVHHFKSGYSLEDIKAIAPFNGNTIIITHNMIVKNAVLYPHILASDVLDILPENILVLCGHFHIPFDFEKGTKRIINPGSFLRFERMQSNKRRPQMLIIDPKDLKVTKREIKCATDAEEIFDMKFAMPETILPELLNLENLKDNLDNVELKSKNLIDAINLLGKEMTIEKDVIELAIEQIQLAEEEFIIK